MLISYWFILAVAPPVVAPPPVLAVAPSAYHVVVAVAPSAYHVVAVAAAAAPPPPPFPPSCCCCCCSCCCCYCRSRFCYRTIFAAITSTFYCSTLILREWNLFPYFLLFLLTFSLYCLLLSVLSFHLLCNRQVNLNHFPLFNRQATKVEIVLSISPRQFHPYRDHVCDQDTRRPWEVLKIINMSILSTYFIPPQSCIS